MKLIPLRNAKDEVVAHAKVDDADHETLSARRWYRSPNGYAVSTTGRNVKLPMHRAVYERTHGVLPDYAVDHIDRDKLNNQRSSLRAATPTENVLNRPLGSLNTTGYFGVRLDTRTGRYQAYTTYVKEWFSIGYFDRIEDAALAHDIHMKASYPNEFLNLNLPQATQEDINRVTAILGRAKRRKGVSRYRGVLHHHYDGRAKCWVAKISVDGKNHYLGYHLTEEDAARAYNDGAVRLLGDKAILNTIPSP